MTTYELRELEEKANKGDAESQFRLGDYYQWDANPTDIAKASKWFELSAENGFIGAQFTLGEFYFQGEGGYEKSYEKAFKWFKKAADSGDGMALWRIGYFYAQGIGVEKNYEESMKWYEKSAEEGYATAQICLAQYLLVEYMTGDIKNSELFLSVENKEEYKNRVMSFGRFSSQTISQVDREKLKKAQEYLKKALANENLEEGYGDTAKYLLSDIDKELTKSVV